MTRTEAEKVALTAALLAVLLILFSHINYHFLHFPR
jgi:hypothetical protein